MDQTLHCQRDFKTNVDLRAFDLSHYPDRSLVVADEILNLAAPHLSLKDPESLKTWGGVEKIIHFLIHNHANRHTHLIAIGGGALLDLVGFAASIYMRGITWHSVPSTLLAMVDASVGGKTAINHHNTKNLLGSFYPPDSIVIDTTFLKTQSPEALASGKAEVIKMLWTSGDSLELPSDLKDIVKLGIDLKLKIINTDWFETTTDRIILNAGHTFGHAFERLDPKLSHGQSVAYGLVAEHELAQFITGQDHQVSLLKKTLTSAGLKTDYHYLTPDVDHLVELALKDKKTNYKTLTSTVVKTPGTPYVLSYSVDDIRRFVTSVCV